MIRTALLVSACLAASSAVALPLNKPAAPPLEQRVHGCHQVWQQGPTGWHRHGKGCELRKGLADTKRNRIRPRGTAI